MTPIKSRVLPRRGAPVGWGLFNIVCQGIAGLLSRGIIAPSTVAAASLMPLTFWWVGFIVIGLIIFAGIKNERAAWLSSAIAFGWWILWAACGLQSLGPLVTLRAVFVPIGLAFLHLNLTPYFRRS